MIKGFKNPHTKEWNKKISEGVKRQWAEGRGNPVGIISSKKPKGVKHYAWKGEKVSYWGMHMWIVREKGLPKSCEHCGRTDRKKYEWANKDHTYKRNLDDYIRLCTSCHRKYDIEHNNYVVRGIQDEYTTAKRRVRAI